MCVLTALGIVVVLRQMHLKMIAAAAPPAEILDPSEV